MAQSSITTAKNALLEERTGRQRSAGPPVSTGCLASNGNRLMNGSIALDYTRKRVGVSDRRMQNHFEVQSGRPERTLREREYVLTSSNAGAPTLFLERPLGPQVEGLST